MLINRFRKAVAVFMATLALLLILSGSGLLFTFTLAVISVQLFGTVQVGVFAGLAVWAAFAVAIVHFFFFDTDY